MGCVNSAFGDPSRRRSPLSIGGEFAMSRLRYRAQHHSGPWAPPEKEVRFSKRFALAVAPLCVGLLLTSGGVQPQTKGPDPTEVAQLRALAEAGHAAPAFQLGVSYVQTDPNEAVKWIRVAAEQKHAGAQAMLGRLYDTGQGVPKDYSQALRWYRRAAEQNDPMAQLHVGLMYYDGNGVPKDDSEAARWFRRAAN